MNVHDEQTAQVQKGVPTTRWNVVFRAQLVFVLGVSSCKVSPSFGRILSWACCCPGMIFCSSRDLLLRLFSWDAFCLASIHHLGVCTAVGSLGEACKQRVHGRHARIPQTPVLHCTGYNGPLLDVG